MTFARAYKITQMQILTVHYVLYISHKTNIIIHNNKCNYSTEFQNCYKKSHNEHNCIIDSGANWIIMANLQ